MQRYITSRIEKRAAKVKAHLRSINPEALLISDSDVALLGVADKKAVYHGDMLASMGKTPVDEHIICFHPSYVSLDDLFLSTLFGLCAAEDSRDKKEIISIISALSAELSDYTSDDELSVIALHARITDLFKALFHLCALSDFEMVNT